MKRRLGAFWRQTFSSLKVPNYRLYFTGTVDQAHGAVPRTLAGIKKR